MEVHVGKATARGSPRELAEYTRELHRLGLLGEAAFEVGPGALSEPPPGSDAPTTLSKPPDSHDEIIRRIEGIPTAQVKAFVKEHPRADVKEFGQRFLGKPITFSTDGPLVYSRAYNKLSHSRRAITGRKAVEAAP